MAGIAATASAKMDLDAHMNTLTQVYNKAMLQLSSSPHLPEEPQKFDGVACQYWWNNNWYNLQDFDNSVGTYFTSDTTGAGTNAQYAAYDFCKLIKDVETSANLCTDTTQIDAYSTIVNYGTTPKACIATSTSSTDSIEALGFPTADGDVFGLKYSNTAAKTSLHVGLICDSNAESFTTTALLDDGAGNYRTTLTSADVCSTFDLNALWQFINEYTWIWCAMFVGIGVFLTFLGRKLFKATIFIIAALLTVFGILLLFYTTFLQDTTEAWVGWTVLGCSILIGLVVGFFTMKLERVGAALIAGWGGFLLGAMLCEAVLFLAGSTVVFWCVSIGCAIAAAVLSFFFYEHVLIIGTAFAGSYMFFRGISFYAGGFPNEFSLAKEFNEGVDDAFTPWFYLYMVLIIILCVVGSMVQYKHNKHNEGNNYE